jgi:hypothetical protein
VHDLLSSGIGDCGWWGFLFALRRHLRRTFFPRHATRAQFVALKVLFGKSGSRPLISSVGFCPLGERGPCSKRSQEYRASTTPVEAVKSGEMRSVAFAVNPDRYYQIVRTQRVAACKIVWTEINDRDLVAPFGGLH